MKKVLASIAIEFVTTSKAWHRLIILVLTLLLIIIAIESVITGATLEEVTTDGAIDEIITGAATATL